MRATHETFAEFGGHAAAGGFTVRDTEVFFLEDRLVEARSRLATGKASAHTRAQHAAAVGTPEEMTGSFLKNLERLAPFGQQNPKPVFLLREVRVAEISHFGKGEEHLKLKITSTDGRVMLDAVAFFAKGALARTAQTLVPGSSAHLLTHVERDTFSRGNPIRLRLLDMRLV